jgi:hypothetical protein
MWHIVGGGLAGLAVFALLAAVFLLVLWLGGRRRDL